MRTARLLPILLALLLPPTLLAANPDAAALPDKPQENPAVSDANQFAADFYQHVRGRPGNLFFSPTSISTALAMAYAGAKGQTAQQMAKVLHFDGPQGQIEQDFAKLIAAWKEQEKSGKVQLNLANAMWGQAGYPFQPAFNQTLQASFGTAIHPADFRQPEQARKAINDWVAQQTQQKIKDLMPPGSITPATLLVLANAIYFKAHWDREFSTQVTTEADFHVTGDKTTRVPMMRQTSSFRYLKDEGFSALEMTYADQSFSMIAFLPDQPDGLADFEKSLTSQKLLGWIDRLEKSGQRQVRVSFPKYKISQDLQLKEILSQMGMPLAFSPRADFSGINAGREPLFIGAAIHKAYVNVDEKGTEAAAATGISVAAAALVSRIPEFKADHPFLFVIRDNQTGGVLFMGRIVNPAE